MLLRGNLHAHTTFSDGVRSPKGLVAEYERLGYDFLAITDHFDHDNLVHPDWPKMPERGSGTYSIRQNTLEVSYDNGPTRRIFFQTRDDPKDPKSITINTYPHEKR